LPAAGYVLQPRWAGEAALHFATADPRGLRTVALGRLAFAQSMVGERELAGSSLECAERLVLSVRTVESHVYNVFSKLGVTSRAEIGALITPASRS
jgi:hypothetical protein